MYPLIPYSHRVVPWNYWDDQFSNDELDALEKIAAEANETAVAGGRIDPGIRRSKVKWITAANREMHWLFDRLSQIVARSNAEHYHFDLAGFGEGLQFTRYEAEDQGGYDWHQDYGMMISRKLSIAMQLSHPDDYKGGWLELLFGQQPVQVVKKRGMLAVFPSYTLHRVTPVTEGVRHSLVVWVSGPPFR